MVQMHGLRRRLHNSGWLSRLRRRTQRGAALVEAAIVLPVLVTITLGVIEIGFIFKDSLTISSAVRSGARIGAVDGVNGLADYDILSAVKSGSGAVSGSAIVAVSIYKYDATVPGGMPAGCDTGSLTGKCNWYSGAFLQTGFTSASFGCGAGAVDIAFCPLATYGYRHNHQSDPPDYIGVYIKISHSYFTGFFGTGPKTMTDKTIMRIEPIDA